MGCTATKIAERQKSKSFVSNGVGAKQRALDYKERELINLILKHQFIDCIFSKQTSIIMHILLEIFRIRKVSRGVIEKTKHSTTRELQRWLHFCFAVL